MKDSSADSNLIDLSSDDEQKVQLKAKEYLNNNDALSAWKVLLAKQ